MAQIPGMIAAYLMTTSCNRDPWSGPWKLEIIGYNENEKRTIGAPSRISKAKGWTKDLRAAIQTRATITETTVSTARR